ncbi:hypothetical protein Dimus_010897 [Dionaea muscipula]
MILTSNSEDEGKTLPKLPNDLLMHKRVIRGKIVSERWMVQNGLEKLFDLIKKQKWEELFTKRDLVFKTECLEFYKNLTVNISWKKEVAKSREETKYCKPLEITRKFANNEAILEARRVKSVEMKPFQRLLQIFVMKNLVPRFRKRDVTSFMDLTYMDYLLTKKKKGEDPKTYDYFEETFLTMCQLKRIDGVWWLGTGEGRRRDDVIEEMNIEAENVENVEMNEGEAVQQDFDWVQVEEDAKLQGEEQTEKEAEKEKFYDALSDEGPVEALNVASPAAPEVPVVLTTSAVQQTMKRTSTGVDPSGPSGSILDFHLLHLQAKFARALQRNTRFQELYQELKSKPPTSPKP